MTDHTREKMTLLISNTGVPHYVGRVLTVPVPKDHWWQRQQHRVQESAAYVDEMGCATQTHEGDVTDKMSVPRIFWAIFPPDGDWARGAVLPHDPGYRKGRVNIYDRDGNLLWVDVCASRKYFDYQYRVSMGIQPYVVEWGIRAMIYRSLRVFGWAAWNRYRKHDPDWSMTEPPPGMPPALAKHLGYEL